jgi:two-component system alkaline phosphatase synthesis response regulator PhoP
LELEGYLVEVAQNGKIALELFNPSHDLVILDVMLPEVNGFDVCKRIRETSETPILFTSAKGNSLDRVTGLKSGADDYLVKPFNLEELLLRVAILIDRKKQDRSIEVFEFGSNKINFKNYTVEANGKNFTLSKRELALLKLLISKKNEVVSRDLILDEVWGKDKFPTSRTIDNYILNFRKYFETDPRNPQYFINLRGVGYKFSLK